LYRSYFKSISANIELQVYIFENTSCIPKLKTRVNNKERVNYVSTLAGYIY
jgi:hypothetical protein